MEETSDVARLFDDTRACTLLVVATGKIGPGPEGRQFGEAPGALDTVGSARIRRGRTKHDRGGADA